MESVLTELTQPLRTTQLEEDTSSVPRFGAIREPSLAADRFKRVLYVATCTYLCLPYVVFFGGWMRQPYAALFIVLLTGVVLAACTRIPKPSHDSMTANVRVSVKTIALVLAPVLLVAIVAGAGGWGFQDTDWLKHNSILKDLVTQPWPVIYDVQNAKTMLTYYTAYQLPAAFVGKLLGWDAANHALFLYTLIGLSLSALWVWLLTGAKWWWSIVAFMAFSGMDVVGHVISTMYLAPSMGAGAAEIIEEVVALEHLEWWSGWGFAQFSSNAALVVWVPNQATAGWLLTSLVLNDAEEGRLNATGVLYLGLCSLWTPFVTLGLIPFVAFLLVQQWRRDRYGWNTLRQMLSLQNVTGLLVGLVVVIYLAGRFEPYALPIDWNGIYQERITLTFLRIRELFLVRYALFVVLEFAILHALLYWYLAQGKKTHLHSMRSLLVLSTGILFALPILNWGWNNEPSMRASIPALFVTALVAIRVLGDHADESWSRRIRVALTCVLIVGSLNAAVEIGRHVAGVRQQRQLVAIPGLNQVESLFQLQERKYRNYYNFVGQYLGSADSQFVKHLAKQ